MAYYSGLCTSYHNLTETLVEKCQAHGWAWQDGILSKDGLFIEISAKEQSEKNNNVQQQGISITGGTGKNGSKLIEPSSPVRLGRTARNTINNAELHYFPADYHIFIYDNEVYLVMKFNIDRFYYLAFGKSTLLQESKGNGLWLSANACYYRHHLSDEKLMESITISRTNGGGARDNSSSAFAPFWNRNDWFKNWSNSVICHGLDGGVWSSGQKRAYVTFEPLIDRMPTAHFSDSPLLPYNIYLERPENKLSLICQFENARFLRIDNHEPEQIITLGHEKWMLFPFYKKDNNIRNGTDGSGKKFDHTGTFGWAIRYEGA